MAGNGPAKPPLAEGDKMAGNGSANSPLLDDRARSHLTLMAVMFGVTLGFWVSTVHDLNNWSLPLVISVSLTLAVVICIYWWYINLCAIYPSHTPIHYFIDFLMVIGLCSMSKSCGDDTHFLWTVSWGSLAAVASLKVWFGVGPIRNHPYPWLTWPPRIAAPIILLLAFYSAMLAYKCYDKHESPSILDRMFIWVPVAIGIIVTLMVARIHRRNVTESQENNGGRLELS